MAFGSVAGFIWLMSLIVAVLSKSGHTTRVLSADFAGVTTVLMVVFVLPVMACAWRGWWPGVALALTVGAVSVAALVTFATV
ncbi:hypothetical protein [Methylobacterium brachythecii]|uniref:Uncharacterized protein n=1 Tax=Methylobacterium brachythecii TaxID=1176177 RepID=A0A7W6AFF3_9HYPH|nr:hypothetical protein [Methylobacterium brachythecii]MBB3902318.1 hypothetical protein [Methylobacterium brachythecii]